jgi:hypothetical protein
MPQVTPLPRESGAAAFNDTTGDTASTFININS